MARKSNLKPGMKMCNNISGIVGEVRGEKGKLLRCARRCVQVRFRTKTGKNKGKYSYAIWNVANLEHVE